MAMLATRERRVEKPDAAKLVMLEQGPKESEDGMRGKNLHFPGLKTSRFETQCWARGEAAWLGSFAPADRDRGPGKRAVNHVKALEVLR